MPVADKPVVTVYGSMFCPYSHRAKHLLNAKGVAFTEIDVTMSPAKRREMIERAGRTSVPQIWIGERHIGGSDELEALEHAGELDRMLAAASSDTASPDAASPDAGSREAE